MLLPDTGAVLPDHVVPPLQVVGALACGPKTVKVMLPLTAGLVVPPESAELIEVVAIAVPDVPVEGPVTVSVGETRLTTWVMLVEVGEAE